MASLSGFLAKKGDTGIVRSWKIRYFELKTDPAPVLTFAESREAAPEGTIDLSKVTGISVNDEILGRRRSEGNRGFQIDVPGHSYQLMATTDLELNHWLDGLENFLPPGVRIQREGDAGAASTPVLSSTPLPTNLASTPLSSTPTLSSTPSPNPVSESNKAGGSQPRPSVSEIPQRKESIAPPRPAKGPSEPISNNPFDSKPSASALSSKSSAETEVEMKSLREQLAQLQSQLKAAQTELGSLKDDKAKAPTSSSTLAVPSLSPRTSNSSLPPLESGEAESEESLTALMKLRDEVLAAMTALRVHGLGAARAFQSARAYRAEVESLRNKLAAKEGDSSSSYLSPVNAPSPPIVTSSSVAPSSSSSTSSSGFRKGSASKTNPFA